MSQSGYREGRLRPSQDLTTLDLLRIEWPRVTAFLEIEPRKPAQAVVDWEELGRNYSGVTS
jgi:hypothetical protein